MKHMLFYHDYNTFIYVRVGIIHHDHCTCFTLIRVLIGIIHHDHNTCLTLIHVPIGIIHHDHCTCFTLIHVHVHIGIIHHDHSTCFTLIQCKISMSGTAVVDSRSCFNRTPTEHTTRVFKSRSQYSAIRIITGLLIKIRNLIQTFATF